MGYFFVRRFYGSSCHNYGMATRKTTLMLDENLYSEVRKRAAIRGQSVSSIVAEALGAYISPKGPEARTRISLTVATGGGWVGPTHATSNRELLDPLDGG
jgi:hypothetical protein